MTLSLATLSSARQLEEGELEALIDAHGGAVLKLARAYLGDDATAEDVFQDVFIEAFRSAGGLRDPSAARAWLLAVAANRCRDVLRSSARRRVAYVAELPELSDAQQEPVEAGVDRELVEAVLQLPLPFREVVYLRYYEGLSVAETARAVGVSAVTVRTRLHRARNLLRRRLSREVVTNE